jgi:hypothetical protein
VQAAFYFCGVDGNGSAVVGDAVRCLVGAGRDVGVDVVVECSVVVDRTESRGSAVTESVGLQRSAELLQRVRGA